MVRRALSPPAISWPHGYQDKENHAFLSLVSAFTHTLALRAAQLGYSPLIFTPRQRPLNSGHRIPIQWLQ